MLIEKKYYCLCQGFGDRVRSHLRK